MIPIAIGTKLQKQYVKTFCCMKKIVISVFLVCSVISLYAQKPQVKVQGKDKVKEKVIWKTYADTREKVSVTYPATWEKKEVANTIFFFMAPYVRAGQKFRENVNLVTGPAEALFLEDYFLDARKKLPENLEGFKELSSKYIKISGHDCARMVYRFTHKDLVLNAALYLIVKDGKAYSLTCTALEGDMEKFYPLFERIAKSFKIK